MSNLSEFIGGGKLCYQEFLASGTFTPSTRLLALGGVVLVEMQAAGGSGALVDNTSGSAQYPSGGDAGQRRAELVTVTGPVTVTMGIPGAAATTTTAANLNGNDGGDLSFGTLVAKGGRKGLTNSAAQSARGGDGVAGPGLGRFNSGDSAARDMRGGRGLDGRGGGGGGACPDVPENQVAVDGGGNGRSESITTLVANVAGYSAANNSGGGGGALRLITTTHGAYSASSGAGGSAWLRVTWFE